MTPIMELLNYTLHQIREQHNFLTANSRKIALNKLSGILAQAKQNKIEDEILIDMVKKIKNEVYWHGFFGIRGKKGSHFLQAINFFITHAEHLNKSQADNASTISLLACKYLTELKPKTTCLKESWALIKWQAIVSKTKKSDEEVVHAARIQKQNLEVHTYKKSPILTGLNNFLHLAKYFLKVKQASKLGPSNPSFPPVRTEEINYKELYKNFCLVDKHRDQLEDEIYELLAHCFERNSPITTAWVFRINRVGNNEWRPNHQHFFERFEKELNFENCNHQQFLLQEKIAAYKKIIFDPNYLEQKIMFEKKNNEDTAKERYQIRHEKELIEARDQLPTNHVLDHFFEDEKYGLHTASELEVMNQDQALRFSARV